MTHPPFLDTLGMWEATASLPEQITSALRDIPGVLAAAPPVGGDVRAVVVLGVGSSGTAADAVAAYGADRATVPVWAGKGYDIPAFVGPHTLVLALSHSGTAGETVAAAGAAHDRGAPVVAVSGGGALSELAHAAGFPVLPVPPGSPNGRSALGAVLVPALLTLAHFGLTAAVGPSLAAAVPGLARRRDAWLAPGQPADEVARRIGRTIPLIYGSSGLTAVAAQRWKTQINENAKTPAFFAVQPDLSHNEVAGWGQHGDVTRQILTLITLRQAGERAEVARRFELVVAATDEVMANVIAVWAEGEDDLARFLDLALFGDLVSLYVAGRERIDPGPVAAQLDVEAGFA